MAAAGVETPAANVVELQDSAGVTALLNGEVDAVWIIDSLTSENVKRLVASPDLNLYNWSLADAFIEKIPYLSKLTLPAGYFDIEHTRPAKDVTVLSTAVTLLVEGDLSPALQWGFLLAARDYQTSNYDDLSAGTVFPKYIDKSVPLSPSPNIISMMACHQSSTTCRSIWPPSSSAHGFGYWSASSSAIRSLKE